MSHLIQFYTFLDRSSIICYNNHMNRKSIQERAKIIQLLVEGNSLRSTSRIADCSINTVTKILVDVGKACAEYQHRMMVDLPCKRIEVDEIWSFVYARKQYKTKDNTVFAGDVWTWIALCPDTKIIPCFRVGMRDRQTAQDFIYDLSTRFANKIQLTTDGYPVYKDAVDDAFGSHIDFAMLVKQYGEKKGKQYGPYQGAIKERRIGRPDMQKTTTAHVECHNLTMRMCIRRFARKTNAHSKKIENHAFAVALHAMYYNFVRIHKTLRITPAMAAGVTDHLWSLEEMVETVCS